MEEYNATIQSEITKGLFSYNLLNFKKKKLLTSIPFEFRYADNSSSKDKVLNGAFKKGDAWFRSGDILVQDEFGYFYFKDRKGDTFRWKGIIDSLLINHSTFLLDFSNLNLFIQVKIAQLQKLSL